MKLDIEHCYNVVKMYMDSITNTNLLYLEIPDVESIMESMGFTEIDVSWYDGILLSGKRDGYSITTANCVNSNVFDTVNNPYRIEIKEMSFLDEGEELYLQQHNYTLFSFKDDTVRNVMPLEVQELQTKLLQLCDELSLKEKTIYIPRIYTP